MHRNKLCGKSLLSSSYEGVDQDESSLPKIFKKESKIIKINVGMRSRKHAMHSVGVKDSSYRGGYIEHL